MCSIDSSVVVSKVFRRLGESLEFSLGLFFILSSADLTCLCAILKGKTIFFQN